MDYVLSATTNCLFLTNTNVHNIIAISSLSIEI